jgi:squalene cyclase
MQAAAASSSTAAVQQAAAASSSKAVVAQQQANSQQQVSQNSSATTSQSNQNQGGVSYDTNTLTGFVNTYGVSPALYKIQHDGMSDKAALDSLPDSMLTFGEQQTKWQLDHGGKPDGQQ